MKLRITDQEGNTIMEDNLYIGDNDVLILQPKNMTVFKFFMRMPDKDFKEMIRSFEESNLIVLPPDIDIKVLQREIEKETP